MAAGDIFVKNCFIYFVQHLQYDKGKMGGRERKRQNRQFKTLRQTVTVIMFQWLLEFKLKLKKIRSTLKHIKLD